MATFLLGSSAFLYHPVARSNHFSSSQAPHRLSESQFATPPSKLCIAKSMQQESFSLEQVQLQRSNRFSASNGSKIETTGRADSLAVTRRTLGFGAVLAWAAFLTTCLQVSQQEVNSRNIEKEEEVVLPNGIRYYDLRVGGGASSRPGDLVVIDVKGNLESNGQVFVDTFGNAKKSLAMVMGSRPYSKGICEGIECALRSMKEGGIRRVTVPYNLGYGDNGADFGFGLQIPPFATLEYIVEKILIVPS